MFWSNQPLIDQQNPANKHFVAFFVCKGHNNQQPPVWPCFWRGFIAFRWRKGAVSFSFAQKSCFETIRKDLWILKRRRVFFKVRFSAKMFTRFCFHMFSPSNAWIPGTWPCHALRQEDCVPSLGACRDVDIRWWAATNPLMSTFFRFRFRSPHQNLEEENVGSSADAHFRSHSCEKQWLRNFLNLWWCTGPRWFETGEHFAEAWSESRSTPNRCGAGRV